MSQLNSGIAYYHSDQNLVVFSPAVYKHNNETFKTIILPVVLYGCETWSLRVFENRVLGRIFGLKR
jgi:hypothetical protein